MRFYQVLPRRTESHEALSRRIESHLSCKLHMFTKTGDSLVALALLLFCRLSHTTGAPSNKMRCQGKCFIRGSGPKTSQFLVRILHLGNSSESKTAFCYFMFFFLFFLRGRDKFSSLFYHFEKWWLFIFALPYSFDISIYHIHPCISTAKEWMHTEGQHLSAID